MLDVHRSGITKLPGSVVRLGNLVRLLVGRETSGWDWEDASSGGNLIYLHPIKLNKICEGTWSPDQTEEAYTIKVSFKEMGSDEGGLYRETLVSSLRELDRHSLHYLHVIEYTDENNLCNSLNFRDR